jgi:hypothetical protein
MSDGATTTTRRRRASRGRRGARSRTTLARRRTYTIRGQCYSRLMYMAGNKAATFGDGTIPVGLENTFDRQAPAQVGLRDYPVVPASLKLLRRGKELESTSSGEEGDFVFSAELETDKSYRLEALLDSGDRVFPERVTLVFKVRKIPDGLKTAEVKVTAVHEAKMDFRSWKTLDKERFTAVLTGSTLWLTGAAALVFDTFALEVEYLSQHLSPDLKRDLSNLRYHTFKYEGKTYHVPLHHLCLATCTTIMLRYYGAKVNQQPVRIEDVAEAAARYALDMHAGKMKTPDWARKKIFDEAKLNDPQRRVVEFVGGEYPHNNMDFVLRGAERLMQQHDPNRKYLWGGGNDDICKTTHPSLTCFLGLGWPHVIADDLEGTWDHGRVCVGAFVDHRAKLRHLYVIDPSRPERLTIKGDGSQSDLGWCIMSAELPQSEVSPQRFTAGGVVPAPPRSPFE